MFQISREKLLDHPYISLWRHELHLFPCPGITCLITSGAGERSGFLEVCAAMLKSLTQAKPHMILHFLVYIGTMTENARVLPFSRGPASGTRYTKIVEAVTMASTGSFAER
jgi:hypothetical protein